MDIRTKIYFHLVWLLILGAVTTSCNKDDDEGDSDSPSEERYTGDAYQDLNSPWVKDSDKKTHFTRWECILFGSYPTNEVVSSSFSAVDDYALASGDVIADATLYSRLEDADWTDDDTEIGGKRYHRLKGSGTVTCSTDREQHYRWTDTDAWHFFAYAPIKWRILKISGTKAVLLADRMPDTCPFHDKDEDVNWSGSHLRQWLNKEFFNRAFSETEREAIELTNVENSPNAQYGTYCGPDTQDYVFILSNNEVFASPLASDYGFYAGSGIDDPARRFRSTLYAKCRGAWWSSVMNYRGNSFWFMRTNGYTPSSITYVCDFGYLYNQGTAVTCDDAAVLPAISIDLTKARYQKAPSVVSTDVND
ncbi:MAG: hypothetical protein IKX33_10520 [Prevotella sp.]|nr:hypothetical protein [Prevotella sp.]